VKPERLSSRNSSDYADRFLNNVRNQILKPTYDQNSGNFIEDQTKKLIEHFNRRFSHKQMDDQRDASDSNLGFDQSGEMKFY